MHRNLPNRPFQHRREPDALTLAALAWLAIGFVLLVLTPMPAHDATYGWSPAFWLIAAPAALLVALHPRAALLPARTWQRTRIRRTQHR